MASRKRGCRLAGVAGRWAGPGTESFAKVGWATLDATVVGCARRGDSAARASEVRRDLEDLGNGYPEGTARSPSSVQLLRARTCLQAAAAMTAQQSPQSSLFWVAPGWRRTSDSAAVRAYHNW